MAIKAPPPRLHWGGKYGGIFSNADNFCFLNRFDNRLMRVSFWHHLTSLEAFSQRLIVQHFQGDPPTAVRDGPPVRSTRPTFCWRPFHPPPPRQPAANPYNLRDSHGLHLAVQAQRLGAVANALPLPWQAEDIVIGLWPDLVWPEFSLAGAAFAMTTPAGRLAGDIDPFLSWAQIAAKFASATSVTEAVQETITKCGREGRSDVTLDSSVGIYAFALPAQARLANRAQDAICGQNE